MISVDDHQRAVTVLAGLSFVAGCGQGVDARLKEVEQSTNQHRLLLESAVPHHRQNLSLNRVGQRWPSVDGGLQTAQVGRFSSPNRPQKVDTFVDTKWCGIVPNVRFKCINKML